MTDILHHVDGSGRGMDDGDCTYCGVSGSLTGECPQRLRTALDFATAEFAGLEAGLGLALARYRDRKLRGTRRDEMHDAIATQLGRVRDAADRLRSGDQSDSACP